MQTTNIWGEYESYFVLKKKRNEAQDQFGDDDNQRKQTKRFCYFVYCLLITKALMTCPMASEPVNQPLEKEKLGKQQFQSCSFLKTK